MPFPTTSVLDDFNRANETPLSGGGNWARLAGYEATGLAANLSSNRGAGASAAADGSSYWTPTTYGPDVEVFFTLPTLPADTEIVEAWLRLLAPTDGPNFKGYAVRYKVNAAAADQVVFIRYDPGTPEGVAAVLSTVSVGTDLTAGDNYGVSAVGSQLTAYGFHSGVWSSLASYNVGADATKYLNAGNIGFTIRNNTCTIDDFGGGTIVPTPTAKPKLVYLRKNR